MTAERHAHCPSSGARVSTANERERDLGSIHLRIPLTAINIS
jgi:hypothetical protein